MNNDIKDLYYRIYETLGNLQFWFDVHGQHEIGSIPELTDNEFNYLTKQTDTLIKYLRKYKEIKGK